jgi:hypothetical protein
LDIQYFDAWTGMSIHEGRAMTGLSMENMQFFFRWLKGSALFPFPGHCMQRPRKRQDRQGDGRRHLLRQGLHVTSLHGIYPDGFRHVDVERCGQLKGVRQTYIMNSD